eukprot:SAG31_NODE_6039_length_2197_cov_1.136320_3_plen_111_part_00
MDELEQKLDIVRDDGNKIHHVHELAPKVFAVRAAQQTQHEVGREADDAHGLEHEPSILLHVPKVRHSLQHKRKCRDKNQSVQQHHDDNRLQTRRQELDVSHPDQAKLTLG